MTPNADPLAALKPIHLPTEPGWWPPAPGWWLLILGLLILAAASTFAWHRWQQRRAPRRQAELELARILEIEDSTQQLTALNQLLRRVAAMIYGPAAASLAPQQWSTFLIEHAPDTHQDPHGWQQLVEAPYRDAVDIDMDVHGMVQAWMHSNLRRSTPC